MGIPEIDPYGLDVKSKPETRIMSIKSRSVCSDGVVMIMIMYILFQFATWGIGALPKAEALEIHENWIVVVADPTLTTTAVTDDYCSTITLTGASTGRYSQLGGLFGICTAVKIVQSQGGIYNSKYNTTYHPHLLFVNVGYNVQKDTLPSTTVIASVADSLFSGQLFPGINFTEVIVAPSMAPEWFARPNWKLGNPSSIKSILSQTASGFVCTKPINTKPECITDGDGSIRWKTTIGLLPPNKELCSTLFSKWSVIQEYNEDLGETVRSIQTLAVITANDGLFGPDTVNNARINGFKVEHFQYNALLFASNDTYPSNDVLLIMANGIVTINPDGVVFVANTNDQHIYRRLFDIFRDQFQWIPKVSAAPSGVLSNLQATGVYESIVFSYGVLQSSPTSRGFDYNAYDASPQVREVFSANESLSSTEVATRSVIRQYPFLNQNQLTVAFLGAASVVVNVRVRQQDIAFPQTAESRTKTALLLTGPSHIGNLAINPSTHIIRFTSNHIIQLNRKNGINRIFPESYDAVSPLTMLRWVERIPTLTLQSNGIYTAISVLVVVLTSFFYILLVEETHSKYTQYLKQEKSSAPISAYGNDRVRFATVWLWVSALGLCLGIGYWCSSIWILMTIQFSNMVEQYNVLRYNTVNVFSCMLLTCGGMVISMWVTFFGTFVYREHVSRGDNVNNIDVSTELTLNTPATHSTAISMTKPTRNKALDGDRPTHKNRVSVAIIRPPSRRQRIIFGLLGSCMISLVIYFTGMILLNSLNFNGYWKVNVTIDAVMVLFGSILSAIGMYLSTQKMRFPYRFLFAIPVALPPLFMEYISISQYEWIRDEDVRILKQGKTDVNTLLLTISIITVIVSVILLGQLFYSKKFSMNALQSFISSMMKNDESQKAKIREITTKLLALRSSCIYEINQYRKLILMRQRQSKKEAIRCCMDWIHKSFDVEQQPKINVRPDTTNVITKIELDKVWQSPIALFTFRWFAIKNFQGENADFLIYMKYIQDAIPETHVAKRLKEWKYVYDTFVDPTNREVSNINLDDLTFQPLKAYYDTDEWKNESKMAILQIQWNKAVANIKSLMELNLKSNIAFCQWYREFNETFGFVDEKCLQPIEPALNSTTTEENYTIDTLYTKNIGSGGVSTLSDVKNGKVTINQPQMVTTVDNHSASFYDMKQANTGTIRAQAENPESRAALGKGSVVYMVASEETSTPVTKTQTMINRK